MRWLTGILIAILWTVGASAADLDTRRDGHKERDCSLFNNFFLFGDPTDCPNDETVPACDDDTVVSRARAFVAGAEPVYLEPEIAEIRHIREQRQTVPLPSPLVRRYCRAEVTLTNGDHTTAYYFIQEDTGFVGLSWKIYVCLIGYDRWRVYDGDCRVARPDVVY